MKRIISAFLLAIIGLFINLHCSKPGQLVVKHQMTGAETNCYLLYDTKSKEAALFDVGGPIDSLLATIEQENLGLKYFFFTHGHGDHVVGLPDIRNKFPDAGVCIHKQDFEDLFVFREWLINHFGQETIDEWCQDLEFKKLMDFDPKTFGTPDIFLEGDWIFKLGEFEIATTHSPGHSPGSICFYVDGILFSGDILFHRRVGRTDLLHSSPEDMIGSVKNLYKISPDETIVYPGHGKFSDIGSEKKENMEIRPDTVFTFN